MITSCSGRSNIIGVIFEITKANIFSSFITAKSTIEFIARRKKKSNILNNLIKHNVAKCIKDNVLLIQSPM